jgi:peptidoglycan/LPS O-acetylase OafA/YrhL
MQQPISLPPIDDSPAGGVRILRKIDALDGFRGVAVLIVVAVHLPFAVPSLFLYRNGHQTFRSPVVEGGGFGVDAFFVLSGFLITAILLRDQASGGRVRFGAFYRRRALRLLPALLVFICLYLYYSWITGLPDAREPWWVLSIIFYYSNTSLRHVPLPPSVSHLWSLAVEEQFYLIWPLCLSLFLALRRRLTPTICGLVGTIAVIAIHRAYMWNHGTPRNVLYTRLDTRGDALLVGCLLAQLWVRNKLPKRGVQLAGWVALALYLYLVHVGARNPFLYRGGYTLIAVAVGVILLAVLETEWVVNRVLRARPLRALGRVSYGLYIWHLPIFYAVQRYGHTWRPPVQMIIALGLSALATYGSWVLVERPFLRWKDRLA